MKTEREKRLEKAVKFALEFMSGEDPHSCEMCGGQTDGLEFHPQCAFSSKRSIKRRPVIHRHVYKWRGRL